MAALANKRVWKPAKTYLNYSSVHFIFSAQYHSNIMHVATTTYHIEIYAICACMHVKTILDLKCFVNTIECHKPFNKAKMYNNYIYDIYMSQSYCSAQQLLYPDIDDRNRNELEGK